ncbi:hypothetical protein RZS08_04935, partial [Arthrospira platensis SPKY1]|nr:hypothetical protein [Arthrospira platensis SPKY1]
MLHLHALRERLQTALANSGDPQANAGVLTSGELALQMFQLPFQQRFEGDSHNAYGVTSQYVDTVLKVAVMTQPLQARELR